MDISDIANAPRVASWMVDLLFGEPSQTTTDTAPPMTTPAVEVPSSAKPSVAAATGQAIANLSAGGNDAGTVAAPSEARPMTASDINAQVASNLRLTSSQISAAIYSSVGVPIGNSKDTLQEQIGILRDRSDWAASLNAKGQPNLSDDYDEKLPDFIRSIQKAFDAHAITFTKLSDIPGVNDTQRAVAYGPPDEAPVAAGWSGGYDHAALQAFASSLPPSEHGGLFSFGGMMVMATWTDESFHE